MGHKRDLPSPDSPAEIPGLGVVYLAKSPKLLKAAFCLCSLELNTGPASEDFPPRAPPRSFLQQCGALGW